MGIKERNLLCVKSFENLDLADQWLYRLYKTVIQSLVTLCGDSESEDFILSKLTALRNDTDFYAVDTVLDIYDGLKSLPSEIRQYYEALLGVTSYYQHSQGGKGKYIEKKIASAFESCSLSIELSELPIWLEYPKLHKKRGLFTLKGLSSQEKRMIRTTAWDWIGDKSEGTDIGTILKSEKTVVLAEIKNRVDSGGVAARREIWTSQKFGIIVNYLLENQKLYRKGGKEFSLAKLLKVLGFETLELYIGILFDKGDRPATIESDRKDGFYSSSKEGFVFLMDKVKSNNKVKIIKEDLDNLQIELILLNSKLKLKVEALYGDDVTLRIFRKAFSVSDLLLLKYDDMWLSQLIAIDERTFLLKYGKNYMTVFNNLLKQDKDLRTFYDNLILSENNEKELVEIIGYLLKKHQSWFTDSLKPNDKPKDEYLGDVIQVLAACEA